MRHCANCRKEVDRVYWIRHFPNVVFCRDCWKTPGATSRTIRDGIAAAIKLARTRNRQIAKDILRSLRGTGVPTNPNRGKHA